MGVNFLSSSEGIGHPYNLKLINKERLGENEKSTELIRKRIK